MNEHTKEFWQHVVRCLVIGGVALTVLLAIAAQ